MIKVNEYFNGTVKSLGFEASDGPATVGLMQPGNYEFTTGKMEIMKVISGKLSVQLNDASSWIDFSAGENFTVGANQKFKLKVAQDTVYICLFR